MASEESGSKTPALSATLAVGGAFLTGGAKERDPQAKVGPCPEMAGAPGLSLRSGSEGVRRLGAAKGEYARAR